jgi:hypothetical protein
MIEVMDLNKKDNGFTEIIELEPKKDRNFQFVNALPLDFGQNNGISNSIDIYILGGYMSTNKTRTRNKGDLSKNTCFKITHYLDTNTFSLSKATLIVKSD